MRWRLINLAWAIGGFALGALFTIMLVYWAGYERRRGTYPFSDKELEKLAKDYLKAKKAQD